MPGATFYWCSSFGLQLTAEYHLPHRPVSRLAYSLVLPLPSLLVWPPSWSVQSGRPISTISQNGWVKWFWGCHLKRGSHVCRHNDQLKMHGAGVHRPFGSVVVGQTQHRFHHVAFSTTQWDNTTIASPLRPTCGPHVTQWQCDTFNNNTINAYTTLSTWRW